MSWLRVIGKKLGKARKIGVKILDTGSRLGSKIAHGIDKALVLGAPLVAGMPELAPVAAGAAAVSGALHAASGIASAGSRALQAKNVGQVQSALKDGVYQGKMLKKSVQQGLEKTSGS